MLYLLRVFVIDCVKTEHRAVAYGLTTFPYLVTPFAGPAIAEAYLKHSSWRWAFGTFAILVPVAGTIMAVLIVWGRSTVAKAEIAATSSTKSTGNTFLQYAIDFDGKFYKLLYFLYSY